MQTKGICPFCKTPIYSDDEVTVCPSCMTPHHRECWNNNKGCSVMGCSKNNSAVKGTNTIDVCKKCGAALSSNQDFCPKCGAAKKAVKTCAKCGAEISEGHDFCPKCGHKVGSGVVSSNSTRFNNDQTNNSIMKYAIACMLIAIFGIVVYISFGKPSVDEIVLSKESLEMKKDAKQSVSYTISPSKAADREVTWKSSNESVAQVDNGGNITAVGDGSCTITVSVGGKSDSLSVTVKTGPDFEQIFRDCELDSEWAEVGSDGSYLTIDTNPRDKDDYTSYAAYVSIYSVNEKLGLPDSLTEKMGKTSALDGRQSQLFEEVEVSWKYHPDNGLEVTYSIR